MAAHLSDYWVAGFVEAALALALDLAGDGDQLDAAWVENREGRALLARLDPPAIERLAAAGRARRAALAPAPCQEARDHGLPDKPAQGAPSQAAPPPVRPPAPAPVLPSRPAVELRLPLPLPPAASASLGAAAGGFPFRPGEEPA